MAGAQHPSVTGMDERTLGRIDLILFDADYRDAHAALEDSWRVAVMAADARMRAAHERARAAAVGAANARRDPTAPRVPTSTGLHRVALGVALVAGVVAVALLTTPRTSGLAVKDALLPAGLLAVGSVMVLGWLEPRRANGSLWGSRIPAVIHFGFGGLWLLSAAAVFGLRWGEVGTLDVLPAIAGLTLLAGAGVAALILGEVAHRADRSGRQTGMGRVTGDLLDQRDADEVFDALDRWWADAGPDALRNSPNRIRAVRREVLGRLRAGRLIGEREERVASFDPDPLAWTERRP
ncbi:hypothetical protein [Micropruina sonneratiae]|uniref:hypothetical protein n=1 Tax=Micropruina sonneratiae TaxID=2986940 RepID=UPI002226D862|nr:hypothetical protein [Micropruina sp. KQZ13P-5]MCW3158987.1 hypothetical protein [Micropruina sp. KQZ13P-5]